jgi:hypothetical protein
MIIVYNFRIFILSARILIPQKDKNNRFLLDFPAKSANLRRKMFQIIKKSLPLQHHYI